MDPISKSGRIHRYQGLRLHPLWELGKNSSRVSLFYTSSDHQTWEEGSGSPYHAILQHWLGILQFRSVLTPSMRTWHRIPHIKGSVPQDCTCLPLQTPGISPGCHRCCSPTVYKYSKLYFASIIRSGNMLVIQSICV